MIAATHRSLKSILAQRTKFSSRTKHVVPRQPFVMRRGVWARSDRVNISEISPQHIGMSFAGVHTALTGKEDHER
jgi:hypothetical protein